MARKMNMGGGFKTPKNKMNVSAGKAPSRSTTLSGGAISTVKPTPPKGVSPAPAGNVQKTTPTIESGGYQTPANPLNPGGQNDWIKQHLGNTGITRSTR